MKDEDRQLLLPTASDTRITGRLWASPLATQDSLIPGFGLFLVVVVRGSRGMGSLLPVRWSRRLPALLYHPDGRFFCGYFPPLLPPVLFRTAPIGPDGAQSQNGPYRPSGTHLGPLDSHLL